MFWLEEKVTNAVKSVADILDSTKSPTFISNVPHNYSDKYQIVESLSEFALEIVRFIIFKEILKLDDEKKKQFEEQLSGRVRLVFEFKKSCKFVEVKVENVKELSNEPTRKVRVAEVKSGKNGDKRRETEIENVIERKVYYWDMGINCVLKLVTRENEGKEGKQETELFNEHKALRLSTFTEESPELKVPNTNESNVSLDLTEFAKKFKGLNENELVKFFINRNDKSCKTPFRNADVEKLSNIMVTLNTFFTKCFGTVQLMESLFVKESVVLHELKAIESDQTLPVIPAVVQENKNPKVDAFQVLSPREKELILESFHAQKVQFEQRISQTITSVKDEETFYTIKLGIFSIACRYVSLCQELFEYNLSKLENDFRSQLISAIGQEITQTDLVQFIKFKCDQILKTQYHLKPFLFDFRRDGHAVEGTIAIEAKVGYNFHHNKGCCIPPKTPEESQPILTFSRNLEPGQENTPRMHFALNASTKVNVLGRQHVHVFMKYKGSCDPEFTYSLRAAARQFSCFVLLVGSIAARHEFSVKNAIIIKNKDLVLIPLLLNTLPSIKQFNDSIRSLSPNQQKFAKAFREFQLRSSVFAIMLVPVKNAMERVLRMPKNSLTKEINLTQQLISLFVDYNIPTDLLSFDGDENNSQETKVAYIKELVENILKMIDEKCKKDLEKSTMEADYAENLAEMAHDDAIYSSQPIAFAPGARRQLNLAPKMMTFASKAPAPESMLHQRDSARQAADEIRPMETSEQNFEPLDTDVDDIVLNYTSLPKKMESFFEALNDKSMKRDETSRGLFEIMPIKVEVTNPITLIRQENLLAKPLAKELTDIDLTREKTDALALLEALSSSGQIELEETELHVMVAVAQSFEDSIIECAIKQDVDIVQFLESNAAAVLSVLHDSSPKDLIKDKIEGREGLLKLLE